MNEVVVSALPALASNYGAEERDAPVFHNSTRLYANARASPAAVRNGRIKPPYVPRYARKWLNVTSSSCATEILCLPRVSLTFLHSFRGINDRKNRRRDAILSRRWAWLVRRDKCLSVKFFILQFCWMSLRFFLLSIPLLRLNVLVSFRRWYIDQGNRAIDIGIRI